MVEDKKHDPLIYLFHLLFLLYHFYLILLAIYIFMFWVSHNESTMFIFLENFAYTRQILNGLKHLHEHDVVHM